MHSIFTRWAAGAAVALSLFGAANMAQASSLTSSQISAIVGLLQSFGAGQDVINNVTVALGGQTSSSLSCASFSDVSYSDFDETPGGRVSQLQTWLGIPSNTFGFGTYGRKTQAAWDAQCGGTQTTPTSPVVTATPSASIDQSSLTTSSGGPTISGSASGVSSVYVAITGGTNQAGTANQTGSGSVSVVNGRWSATIYPKADVFTAGVYSVSVYTTVGGALLTTGTLSILGNALQSSATPTCTLTSSATSINPGQSVTLNWTSQNAVSAAWLAGDAAPTNGSKVFHITSSYTSPWYEALVVVNAAGASNKCTISIPINNVAAGSAPVVTGVNGAGGFGPGSNNQVSGSHFTGTTVVYLTSNAAVQTQLTFTTISDTQLNVVVPNNLPSDFYSLTVINSNGVSNAYNVGWLGVTSKPSVSSVSGAGGFGPGSNNQIIGQNFLQVNSIYLVSANGTRTDLTYTVANSSQINVTVPTLPSGSYTLYVGTSGGQATFAVTL